MDIFSFDYLRAEQMIREFASACKIPGEFEYECIYQSADPGKNRYVLKVTFPGLVYALKIDRTGRETGRLKSEFDILQRLHQHFSAHEKLTTPEPLYLSGDEDFYVMPYHKGRTAADAIRQSKNSNATGQVFRRAGHWLHVLHTFENPQQTRFWPNWMIEAAEAAIANDPQASPAEYGRMLDRQRKQLGALSGTSDLKVFRHGDFHSLNVILGKGVTHAIDFAETSTNLAVYDIADFLVADIYWDDPEHKIDSSGVSRRCREMFFRLYRHPVNTELLDLSIRGRLLIDWLTITARKYETSAYRRDRFERLRQRLHIAFAD